MPHCCLRKAGTHLFAQCSRHRTPPCRHRSCSCRAGSADWPIAAEVLHRGEVQRCGLRDTGAPTQGVKSKRERPRRPENLMGAGVATNPHYPEINRPLPGLSKASQLRRLGPRKGKPSRSPGVQRLCPGGRRPCRTLSGSCSSSARRRRIGIVFPAVPSTVPAKLALRKPRYPLRLVRTVRRCLLTVSAMKQNSHADPSRAKHNHPVDK